MQFDPKIENGIVDPATGFMSFPPGGGKSGFGPTEKMLFLENYKKTGNFSKAAGLVGISTRIIGGHLRVDKAFKAAYDDTLEAMVNELEQTMFERAKDPKGTLDRFGWLRAHKPGKYNPRPAPPQAETQTDRLENLFNKILEAEPLKGENNEAKEV